MNAFLPGFLLMAWIPAAGATQIDPCEFSASRMVIERSKLGYAAEWTLKDGTYLQAPLAAQDEKLKDLQDWVARHTKFDWRGLLHRHREIVEEAIAHTPPTNAEFNELKRDLSQTQAVLNGLGNVHRLACLESIPYREFLKLVDLRKYPQEFVSLVFKKNGEIKIVGAFYFNPDASGPSGAADSPALTRRREKLKSEGWAYFAHIHNHPLDFSDMRGDLGGELAPSEPDIQQYLRDKPERAIISNGTETVDFSLENIRELDQLR